ncbi:unnamed protein product [Hermetia illucens]|uniref:RRM domain-containing protein n=1 Tax=Hermetia illucens TaxID=343691 RepID=A0A7R8Z233_HERIL|nr:probable splicing factor, arginine/serine-rich 6 [Hermetia illucens]CAD7092583.1 unnamed protein product [Hermetia illucens]
MVTRTSIEFVNPTLSGDRLFSQKIQKSESEMTSVVHITGLVNEIERKDLENICRPYGAVVQIRLGRGVPKEAFVEFNDPNSAANIVKELNGQEMCGMKIELYVNYNNEGDSSKSRKYRNREAYSTRRDASQSRTEDRGRRKSSRSVFDSNRCSDRLRGPRREFGNSLNCRRVDASKKQMAMKRDRSKSRAPAVDQRTSYRSRYPSKRDEDFHRRGLMRNDSKTRRYHDNRRSRNRDETKDRNVNKYGRVTSRDRSESPCGKYRSVVTQPAKRRRVDSTGSSYSTTSSQHTSVSSRGVTPDSGNWD